MGTAGKFITKFVRVISNSHRNQQHNCIHTHLHTNSNLILANTEYPSAGTHPEHALRGYRRTRYLPVIEGEGSNQGLTAARHFGFLATFHSEQVISSNMKEQSRWSRFSAAQDVHLDSYKRKISVFQPRTQKGSEIHGFFSRKRKKKLRDVR